MPVHVPEQRSPAEPPPSPTLPHLVRAWAESTPDAPALVAGDVRWTYAELDDAVRRAAGALGELGLGAGSRVGLLGTNTASWLAAAVGAMWAGGRVDAFNTWVKAWDLEHLLETSACEVLVVTGRVRGSDMLSAVRELVPEVSSGAPGAWSSARFPALRHVVVLGGHPETPSGAHSFDDLLAAATPVGPGTDLARPEQPAYVMYTSGSTSRPKAVPLCQRDLLVNGFHIGERMGLGSSDRVWLGSPLFWSFGGANALPATWTHGACLVLPEQFSAAESAELLAREEVTAAYLLPGIIDALAGFGEQVRAARSLRTGLTIGRPEEVARAVDELDVPGICNIYGATETYGNCCVTHHDTPLDVRLSTQGPPLPGVEVRVVDAAGTVLDAGELGELQVRGRVTPGYLGDDEANAKAFTDDGWYRTGDRLRVRPDGAVEFGARLTDMIKTSGINVAPAEVESYLAGHPDVVEVAVVGAPHRVRGEVVMAFVVLRDDAGADGEALRAYCKDGIAGFKVPWEVVVTEELPRTATGKLTRRTLVETAAERVGAL
ncbi:class I adenylate-forming enzyme family protein [Pseudonocardia sp. KRD291]|uniref:class I adenylate-forming enzyme family protein n=1 Tax=Pseudonocardia sp. KRD291 TaxID=2792007 RepID=UPI001C49E922|nr:AMP-binding protein [Pseudonocardia sp. KRD291]MBW0102404.1 AMP-binding protein [Pseudonocardia sp. KRD291]